MGSKRKQVRFEDEIECMDRRRSSRIVALEEKKQLEKERRLAIALERKNKHGNHDVKNKGKGKATMEVGDDFSDFNNEEGPTKKARRSKEFNQLISSIKSIQELGRQSQNASTSGTNDSSLNGMPLKNILEIIIDFLQRRDLDELFAEPVNPNVVENYYEIVKQPMDFATMRAKLHEGMYTDIEQFKRDIFLICSNAVSAYPEGSRYQEVAEDISKHAKWTFEALRVDPQHLDVELSHNQKPPIRKAQKGQQRTPRRVAPKHGAQNSTETQKRDSYYPPNKPFFPQALESSNNSNIQLNANTINYKESLLRFVKGLGPVAEKVAAQKIAAAQDQQLCIRENVSGITNMHQPTPKAPTHPVSLNAQTLPLSLPLLNRPLTIPGSAAWENRTVNTNNVGSVNMGDRPHQRNQMIRGENWHACAAALLSNFFFENGQGSSSNANETMDARARLKGKMVAPVDNMPSLLGPVQDSYKKQHLGVNNSSSSSNTIQWNNSTNMPNMFPTGSSSSLFAPGSSRNLFPIVHPTRVISGPQPRPMRTTSLSSGSTLSGLPVIQQPGIGNTMTLPRNNLPLYQSMQGSSTSCMPSHNLAQPSPVRQPRPDDIVNLADLRLKPQSDPRNLMYGMPSNNLTGASLMQEHHQPWPADSRSSLNSSMLSPLCQPLQGQSAPLYGLDQPMSFEAMMESQNFTNATWPMQASFEQVTNQAATFNQPASQGFPDMQRQALNHVPFPPQQPNSSSSLQMALGGATNFCGGGRALAGQQEESPPQLSWYGDPIPNLDLEL